MYKPPYTIQPSSFDFFSDKLHGTGKWRLQQTSHPFDSINYDVGEQFALYNFYYFVGKSVTTEDDVLRREAKLVRPKEYCPVPYVRKSFTAPHPTQESVDALLVQEAKRAIPISFFGSTEKKRQMYVIERRGSRLDEEEKKWIVAKDAFEKGEDENEAKHNATEKEKQEASRVAMEEFNKKHISYDLFLNANQEEVEEMLKWVDPYFPFDFNMFYQVDLSHKLVNISFEAPSSRIIPLEKKVIHSRGSSMKPKTMTEVNRDYLNCVCSIAYVIAAQCFNKTAKIEYVYISAYVKELNPHSATFEEETLYAIVFDRATFNWVIKPKSFLPYESLVFFPHNVALGSRMAILPIDPLDLVPAGEILPGNNQFIDNSIEDNRFPSNDSSYTCYANAPIDINGFDDRFEEAAKMVVVNQRGLTVDLQRMLGMGYAKAGRVMDQLEAVGIVGPQEGALPREVLIKDLAELDKILQHLM